MDSLIPPLAVLRAFHAVSPQAACAWLVEAGPAMGERLASFGMLWGELLVRSGEPAFVHAACRRMERHDPASEEEAAALVRALLSAGALEELIRLPAPWRHSWDAYLRLGKGPGASSGFSRACAALTEGESTAETVRACLRWLIQAVDPDLRPDVDELVWRHALVHQTGSAAAWVHDVLLGPTHPPAAWVTAALEAGFLEAVSTWAGRGGMTPRLEKAWLAQLKCAPTAPEGAGKRLAQSLTHRSAAMWLENLALASLAAREAAVPVGHRTPERQRVIRTAWAASWVFCAPRFGRRWWEAVGDAPASPREVAALLTCTDAAYASRRLARIEPLQVRGLTLVNDALAAAAAAGWTAERGFCAAAHAVIRREGWLLPGQHPEFPGGSAEKTAAHAAWLRLSLPETQAARAVRPRM